MTYSQMVAGYVAVLALVAVVLLAVDAVRRGSGERWVSKPQRRGDRVATRPWSPRVLRSQSKATTSLDGPRLRAG